MAIDSVVNNTTVSVLPYNSKNKLLTDDDLKHILKRYGVNTKHRNLALYQLAMVHRSYCTRKNENFVSGNTKCPVHVKVRLQEMSNERLEFLGDAVLSLVVAEYLYERYPIQDEGFLTSLRSKLVCGKMLSKLCGHLGLAEWAIISKQVEDDGGRDSAKLQEDALEAFIGALFLDFGKTGFSMAKTFIVSLIETFVDFAQLVSTIQSNKDRFVKAFAARYGVPPVFVEHQVGGGGGVGQSQAENTHIAIKDRDGCVVAVGSGPNKKEAEQDATNKALVYLGVA
jgi:ribonuclease-3